jgi:septal ring factor EnvC (AmiA/AmiB activator)
MLVNLNDLSADELLKLARKKQHEEQERARHSARVTHLAQLRKRREQLILDQQRALLILDKELQSLQQRRTQLVMGHESALAALDKEMAEVSAGACTPETESAAAPGAAPAGEETSKQTGGAPDERAPAAEERRTPDATLATAILDLLKGRVDMSDSLMRERLRGLGIDAGRFAKAIAQLVREGKVVSKGAGNYALKKRL